MTRYTVNKHGEIVEKPTTEPRTDRVHTSSAIRRALATAEEMGLVAPSSAAKKVREPMTGGWRPPADHVEYYSQLWAEMQGDSTSRNA